MNISCIEYKATDDVDVDDEDDDEDLDFLKIDTSVLHQNAFGRPNIFLKDFEDFNEKNKETDKTDEINNQKFKQKPQSDESAKESKKETNKPQLITPKNLLRIMLSEQVVENEFPFSSLYGMESFRTENFMSI